MSTMNLDCWNDGELECRIVFTQRMTKLPILQYLKVYHENQEYSLLQTTELRMNTFGHQSYGYNFDGKEEWPE